MDLTQASQLVPPGRYAVAVSGGADSVALLHLLAARADLALHVVTLDHETRAGESAIDAAFVCDLAASLHLPYHARRRSQIEQRLNNLPANLQARYRLVRLALFREAIETHHLDAVLQAHHADDQAETILLRLIRGTGIEGLRGISAESHVEGVRILRPLLPVRRQALRDYLQSRNLAWREDSSNAQPDYLRNRVRQILAGRPDLVDSLLDVSTEFGELSDLLDAHLPALGETLAIPHLAAMPLALRLHLLRRWLLDHQLPPDGLSLALLKRINTMIEDHASAPAITLPGALQLRRRKGELAVMASPPRRAGRP